MPGGTGQQMQNRPRCVNPRITHTLPQDFQGILQLVSHPRALPEPFLGLCIPCSCKTDLNAHGSRGRGCTNCPSTPQRCQCPPGLLCGTSCIPAGASRDGFPGYKGLQGCISLLSHTSLRSRPGAAMHWPTGWEKRCKTLFGSREVMGSAMQPSGSHPEDELCSPLPGDAQSPRIWVKVFAGKL